VCKLVQIKGLWAAAAAAAAVVAVAAAAAVLYTSLVGDKTWVLKLNVCLETKFYREPKLVAQRRVTLACKRALRAADVQERRPPGGLLP